MAVKRGAGKYNRLITLQRLLPPSGTPDSFGEITGEPVDDIKNLRAAYDPGATFLRGQEFPESEKRQASTR